MKTWTNDFWFLDFLSFFSLANFTSICLNSNSSRSLQDVEVMGKKDEQDSRKKIKLFLILLLTLGEIPKSLWNLHSHKMSKSLKIYSMEFFLLLLSFRSCNQGKKNWKWKQVQSARIERWIEDEATRDGIEDVIGKPTSTTWLKMVITFFRFLFSSFFTLSNEIGRLCNINGDVNEGKFNQIKF